MPEAPKLAQSRTDHSKGTHKRPVPLTSHMRHDDNQAGDGPRQTDPASLTSPDRLKV